MRFHRLLSFKLFLIILLVLTILTVGFSLYYIQIETAQYEIEIEYGDDGMANEIEYIDEDGETFVKITLIRETVPGFSVALVLVLIFGVIGIIIWRKRSYFQNK